MPSHPTAERSFGPDQALQAENSRDQKSRPVVLVVDDDPHVLNLIAQTLHREFAVRKATSVESALDQFEASPPDLVILDYAMPERTGLEGLNHIRRTAPQIPVIMLTGFGDLKIARQALSQGAVEYMTKPFVPEDFRQVVRRWTSGNPVGEPFPAVLPDSPGENEEPVPVAMDGNHVEGRLPSGEVFSGRLLRFNPKAAVVQLPDASNGTPLLVPGQRIENLKLVVGKRELHIPEATLYSAAPHRSDRIWTLNLPSRCVLGPNTDNLPGLPQGEAPALPLFSPTGREQPPPAFKAAVLDLADLMRELHDNLIPWERRYRNACASDRLALETQALETARTVIFPRITECVAEFEFQAMELHGKQREAGKAHAQSHLFPMLLSSPFMFRIIEKPLGISGDYGMLQKILANPYEGYSLFARLLNAWIITSPAGEAYRHRVEVLFRSIQERAYAAHGEGRYSRIMSLGCGAAEEVQRFLAEGHCQKRTAFHLLDFNQPTLQHTRRALNAARYGIPPDNSPVIDIERKSVKDVVGSMGREHGGYDLIYCAGLFDYLSTRMCRKLLDVFSRMLDPGGQILVCNFTPRNPIGHFMDLVLDWPLIHRNRADMLDLIPESLDGSRLNFTSDRNGVESFMVFNH